MRDEILRDRERYSSTGTRVTEIIKVGNLFFYKRRAPEENDFRLYVREGMTGAERVLVDPEKIASDGKRRSIGSFTVSKDGRYLSYISSIGGSENGELRIVETATGKVLSDVIDRTRGGSGSWLPDGKSFLYPRLQKLGEDAAPIELYQKMRVYLHVLGTDPDKDKPVFGFEVNPKFKLDPAQIPFAGVPFDSKYIFAVVNSGVSPNSEIYVAPLDALERDAAQIEWRKIAAIDDEIAFADNRGDDLYLLTYKNTPRFKIVHVNLKNADLKNAETIFPASEAVVDGLAAARDALYVQTLDGGSRKIYRVDYRTKKAELLKLPYDGSATISDGEPGSSAAQDGIRFNLDSWTRSTANFYYDPKTKTAIDTRLIPPIEVGINSNDYEIVNTKAKSYDGTMIPLVIIYKKGIKRDGSNPVLMDGYGSYGREYTSPFFSAGILPWLNRGGVYVTAGGRGGGEYGEEWHLAGKGATKPNTWRDFIACAEYLIKEKYTLPAHLGIQGGSAGGILISNAITTRPDLFGAAIINVGLNNALLASTLR